LTDFL